MKNTYIKFGIIIIVVAIISYSLGLKNNQSNSSATANQNKVGNFSGRNGGMRNMNGGITGGQVISKDSNSLTLQLRNGGSINILYSSSTQIQKSVTGNISDVVNGNQVMVSGTPNADGSISAQNIQIRSEAGASSTVPFGR